MGVKIKTFSGVSATSPSGVKYTRLFHKALNSLLEEVTFKSNVGTIVLRGEHPRTFLAFDDSSLYYDVTTEEDRSAKGIEIVEYKY